VNISELVKITHQNAKEKGFWEDWERIQEFKNMVINISVDGEKQAEIDTNNAIGTRLMLIVSEVSESLEALRNNDRENFAEELADVIIRTCDLAGGLEIDLELEIVNKINKNKDRPYKHGKEF